MTEPSEQVPTDDQLAAAYDVVSAHLERTPVVPLRLTGIAGPVLAKLETMQPTGSFKVRGALAACAAYAAEGARIVTASAGNHGLGIAYAATRLDVPATVVVPETASPAKVAALRGFDVDLRQIGQSYDEAESAALDLARADGRFVSAYNDPHVIAGQATLARELLEQVEPATVLVPVGGGGLAAGTARVLAGRAGWHIIGVEAARSPVVSSAMAAGRVIPVDVGDTIADGLAGNIETGSVTPALLAATNTPVCGAPEPAIRSAVAQLATEAGLVVEGSGAVGVAALREGLVTNDGDAESPGVTVVLLTGRNIATGLFCELLAE
ncbi:pyridoxal-phosphate dependent enzyme [Nostocoides sp. F2B08]|uniref:threonine ammonia-lyase n=1 Tax=Nostocoides sp. F2B08 TaxID=2653936 RepID=UPI001262E318|nr:pyridoxal-phosphate dependent enzyme [Tetrasphaera sp. F2B08]KAB7745294.1 pyridoxal-phosphate dependent enzyme [Tetrasphaera sp. F2B08]